MAKLFLNDQATVKVVMVVMVVRSHSWCSMVVTEDLEMVVKMLVAVIPLTSTR